MPTLFFHRKAKKYLLYLEDNEMDLKCGICEKVFDFGRPLVIHKSFTKNKGILRYLCMNCVPKSPKLFHDEFIMAKTTNIIPENSHVVSMEKTQMKSGNISVYEAAYMESHGTDIDRTRYAGRESFEGARIGMTKAQILEHEEKAQAEADDPAKFLEMLKESKFLEMLKESKPIVPKLLKDNKPEGLELLKDESSE